MKQMLRKSLSLVLSLALLLTLVPVSYADDVVTDATTDVVVTEQASVDAQTPVTTDDSAGGEKPAAVEEQGGTGLPSINTMSVRSVNPNEGFFVNVSMEVDGETYGETTIYSDDDGDNSITIPLPEAPTNLTENDAFLYWTIDGNQVDQDYVVTKDSENEVNVIFVATLEKMYSVSFCDKEGNVVDVLKVKKDDSINVEDVKEIEQKVLINDKEKLLAWKIKDSLVTESFDFSTKVTENIELEPVVKEGTWITFDSTGGSYVESLFVAVNEDSVAPTEPPTKAGYKFKYWSLSENGSEYSFGNAINDKLTLYAVWEAVGTAPYTVIHLWQNANDDEYSYKESESKSGNIGDYTQEVAKKYSGFKAVRIEQSKIAGDGSAKVYVYYDRNEYIVSFHKKGFWGGFGDEISQYRIKAKYGANIADKWPGGMWTDEYANYHVDLKVMPIGGIKFLEYKSKVRAYGYVYFYYEEIDDEDIIDSSAYKPFSYGKTTKGIKKVAANGSLYNLGYTAIFTSSNWTGFGGTVAPELDMYKVEGFTLVHPTENMSPSFQNEHRKINGKRVYGYPMYYSRNEYNIEFYNGKTVDKKDKVDYQEDISVLNYMPNKPSNIEKGFVFDGWYDNPECVGKKVDFTGKKMPANNLILYAKWAAPELKLSLDTDNDGVLDKEVEIGYGEVAKEKLDAISATIDGFVNWYILDANGKKVPFNLNDKVYESKEIYARINDGTTFTLSYNLGDASGTLTDDNKYLKEAKAVIKGIGTVAKPGYTFVGWQLGNKVYQAGDLIEMVADTRLTAMWDKNVTDKVVVKYHANFAATTLEDKVIDDLKNNQKHTTLADDTFERPDYKLIGWSKEAGKDNKVDFECGTEVRVDNKELVDGSNHLYAVWEQATAKVVFKAGEHGKFDKNKTEIEVDYIIGSVPSEIDGLVPTPTTVEQGYKFIGWDPSPFKAVTAAGATYTAKYEEEKVTIHYKAGKGGYFVEGMPVHNISRIVKVIGEAPQGVEAVAEQGYEFKDWTKKKNGQDVIVSTEKIFVPEKINGFNVAETYYANFTKNVITFTAKSKKVEYNGKEQSLSSLLIPNELSYTVSPSSSAKFTGENGEEIKADGKGTDVGNYDITFANKPGKVKDENGKLYFAEYSDKKGILEITPKIVTISAIGKAKVYGEKDPKDLCDITGLLPGDSIYYMPIREAGEDVGDYKIKVDTREKQGNYKVVLGKIEDFKINPKEAKIIPLDNEKYFNDPEPKLKYKVEGLINGDAEDKIDCSCTRGFGQAVGKYDIYASGEPIQGNYKLDFSAIGTFTIKARAANELKLEAPKTEDLTKVFDGKPLTGKATAIEGAKVEYKYPGQDWTEKVPSITVAGTLEVEVRANKEGYAEAKGSYKLTVLPRKVTVKADNNSKVYGEVDPNPLTTATVTGTIGSDAVSYEFSRVAGEDVGDYAITVSGDAVQGNYSVTYTGANFKITPAAASDLGLEVKGYTDIYDAASHAASASVTVVDGTTISYSVDDGATWTSEAPEITNVGEVTVKVKAENANYETAEAEVTLKVEKKAVTMISVDAEKPYDGTALTAKTVNDEGFVSGEGVDYTVTGTQTEVGSSLNEYTYEKKSGTDLDNYTITKNVGKLTVTVDESNVITVTADSKTREYDGLPLTDDGFSHAGTLVDGHKLVVNISGSQTEVGSSENKVTSVMIVDADKNDVTKNYKLGEHKNGMLTIKPKTGLSYTVQYMSGDKKLRDDKVVGGQTMDKTVTESAVYIAGYKVSGDTSKTITIAPNNKDNVITFYYRKIPNTGYNELPNDGGSTGGGSGASGSADSVETFEDGETPLGKLNVVDHNAYIQGYPDGTVQPQGLLTRQEVAAVFFRLLDKEYREGIRTQSNKFSDVKSTRWSNKHISTLANGKIIKGYTDGTFRPDRNITRAELAVIASRFDKLEKNAKHNFSDIKGHWAEKYIASAVKKGWVNGYKNGTFKPNEYITRAEFVTFVNNVLNRHVKEKDILKDARKFTDLENKDAWYYCPMKSATNSYLYNEPENEEKNGNLYKFQKWTKIIKPLIEF